MIATIPVLAAGFLIKDYVETALRNINVMTATTLIFGLLLGIADRFAPQTRALAQLTWKTSRLIGLAQMFAVIPGRSRSGVTMTAALFCGLKRETAARFLFLLSIPTIAAAGLLKLIDLMAMPDINWESSYSPPSSRPLLRFLYPLFSEIDRQLQLYAICCLSSVAGVVPVILFCTLMFKLFANRLLP
jgi:hypothetical protein